MNPDEKKNVSTNRAGVEDDGQLGENSRPRWHLSPVLMGK